jgi:Rrf2 family nitric oxide-sensitive transcriptional repressor
MVLIYLVANQHRLATIHERSTRFDVSRSHMMKVVNQLIRHGYVGKGDGLPLEGSLNEIGVDNVVRHMGHDLSLVETYRVRSCI